MYIPSNLALKSEEKKEEEKEKREAIYVRLPHISQPNYQSPT